MKNDLLEFLKTLKVEASKCKVGGSFYNWGVKDGYEQCLKEVKMFIEEYKEC